MSAYVYVLRSSLTGRHAIGSTANLEQRIAQYTSSPRQLATSEAPWECVYVEIMDGLDEARKRATYLKSLKAPQGEEDPIRVLYTTRINSRPNGGGK
jgi:predicted GIY-YIG superfamily endonuclease